MFLVDTNILLYAVHDASPRHAVASSLLERWRRQPTPWFTTWPILYEFMRLMTHPRMLRSPWSLMNATSFVHALLQTPSLSVLTPTSRHMDVLELTVGEVRGLSGSIVHDLHTAVLMREHGVSRVVTSDRDFTRFPFLDVIDPFRPGGGPMLVSDGPHPAYGPKQRSAPAIKRRPRRARGAR